MIPPGGSFRWLLLSFLVLSLALVVSLVLMSPESAGDEAGLDEVLNFASEGEISSATFYDRDARVVLTTSDEKTLWAAVPGGGPEAAWGLIGHLASAGAEVRVEQQWAKRGLGPLVYVVLPLMLVVNLSALLVVLARGS